MHKMCKEKGRGYKRQNCRFYKFPVTSPGTAREGALVPRTQIPRNPSPHENSPLPANVEPYFKRLEYRNSFVSP